MGRSDKGKKQEEAQTTQNDKNQAADRGARDKSVASATTATDKLEATPGYTPQDIANDRSRNAAVIGGAYEGAEDQLARTAAATGHENDSGLYPQMKQLAASKTRMETGADMDFIKANADQSLQTRRMLPGLRFAPAGVYGSSASGLAGNNASLINGRMTADSVPTFGQSLGLGLVSSAGQVGAAYAGKG